MTFLRPRANSPHSRRQRVDDPAIRALVRQALGGAICLPAEDSAWALDQIAIGGQARIYIIQQTNGRPIDSDKGQLVIKLFNPEMPDLRDAVNDAFDGLARLSRALEDVRIDGWQLCCPLPVHKSTSPHTLVMTAVPGTSLSHLLIDANFADSDVLADTIVPCVAEALRRFWTSGEDVEGRIYGDLNLHNILCDLGTRTLSFVDCGMPDRFWLCEGASRRHFPVSRDLGYLLYSVASSVRASLGKPHIRRREIRLARQIIGACICHVARPDQRQDLLDEIASCARWHLADIRTSASPGGLWRYLVKRAAERCIARVIEQLRREPAERVGTADGVLDASRHGVMA